jgi:hypothetical protein
VFKLGQPAKLGTNLVGFGQASNSPFRLKQRCLLLLSRLGSRM